MANGQERGGPEDLGQDPFVERLRPDPSQPPERVRVLEGLLGDSDREGYKRLYFNRELDYYAEFRTEDVLFSEPIPSEQPPFLGQQATRVGIRREATIEFTRVRMPRPVDEFDLDIRLATPGRRGELLIPQSRFDDCPECTGLRTGCDTDFGPRCPGETGRTDCLDCPTQLTQCGQATCQTCPTQCGTCQTCQTCPGQATCQTCQTCRTQCNQPTCRETCQGCPPTEQRTCFNTRCFTCRGDCQTP
jgi:hypothetical protein